MPAMSQNNLNIKLAEEKEGTVDLNNIFNIYNSEWDVNDIPSLNENSITLQITSHVWL